MLLRRLCTAAVVSSMGLLGLYGAGLYGGVAGAAKLTGTPIKIMNISQITDPTQGQPTPEAGAGVVAAAKAINAAGGINGHPIKVIVCNDQDNSNTAAGCARAAVADGVVAVVGDNTEWGNQIIPIIGASNIASIGSLPVTPQDFGSSNSFPIQPGGVGSIANCGYLLAKLGATNIDEARVDNNAAAEIKLFANLGIAADNPALSIKSDVPVPATAPDMSTYVAQVSGSNGLIMAMEANQAERFLKAVRASDYTGKICTSSSVLAGTNALKNFGSSINGVYVVNEFRPQVAGGAGWSAILSGFKKYAPAGTLLDDYSVNSWVSTVTFANLAKTLSTVTAASVLTGFTNAKNVATQGMTPPFSATPLTLPPPFGTALSQAFNQGTVVTKFENGKQHLVYGVKFLHALPTPGYLFPSK